MTNSLIPAVIFDSSQYYSSALVLSRYDLNSLGDDLPIECQQPRKLISWLELDYYIQVAVNDLTAYQALLSGPSPTYGQIYQAQKALDIDFRKMNDVVTEMLADPYITAPLRIAFLKSVQFTEQSTIMIESQQPDGIVPASFVSSLLSAFQTFVPMIDYQLNAEIAKTLLKKFVADLQNGISAIKQYQALVLYNPAADLSDVEINLTNVLSSIKGDTTSLMSFDSVGSDFYNFLAGVGASIEAVESDLNNANGNVLPQNDVNDLLSNLEMDSAYMTNMLKGDVLGQMIDECVSAMSVVWVTG